MRRGLGAACRGAALAVVLVLAAGCGITHVQDLNFRIDDRLHFTSPKARSLVKQPVTVSWRIDDFRIAAPGSEPPSDDAGYFAVFVDRTPIKPGKTMKAVAKGDRFCERDPKCPDAEYLRQHFVFTTTQTTLHLPQIPDLAGRREKIQLHTITVVLMDTAGHRIGESAWQLDVRIRKVSSL